MNKKNFKITLKGYVDTVLAFNREQAVILVQAEAIKKGQNHKLLSIEEIE